MKEAAAIIVGKIVGVHGIRGNLKMLPYIDSLDLLAAGESVFLGDPTALEDAFVVRWTKPHQRVVLISLEEIEDRDAAERMVGREVSVEKSRLPELEEGTYYWTDLIGLTVFTVGGRCLGRLASILRTGSNDVYVVRTDGEEVLIPALSWVVKTVDLENGTMVVDPPEGLL